MPNRAEILKQQLMQSLGLPWQELLPESKLEAILKEENISYSFISFTSFEKWQYARRSNYFEHIRRYRRTHGNAVDISIQGYTAQQLAAQLSWWKGGMGIYPHLPNRLHLDLGPKRKWGF